MNLLGSDSKESSRDEVENTLDLVDTIARHGSVLFRCEGATSDDREMAVMKDGSVAIRYGSKGGVYDVNEDSVEFGERNGLYRVSMGQYGLKLAREDFQQFFKMYHRLRDED